MLTRLLKADLARGMAVAITLAALIALASTLMSASTALIVNTVAATNQLSQRAKVPDLIQMHAGEADVEAVEDWAAEHHQVTEYEVIKTLPIPRHEFWINGAHQADSYQEPAFVTAPQRIDLLLGDNGKPLTPEPGEVALPVHYLAVGMANVGDTIVVKDGDWSTELTVVGFIRDAQMNAAMIPSKRLVVHPKDFAELEQHIADREYLFEFDLDEGTRPGTIINEYKAAGLPSRGIYVDASMLQLMNAVSTMLIAAVALIVALVLVVVAVLALRYTVLAAIEADLPRIAVLKAIGAPQNKIRRLYLLKYLALAITGAVVGYVLGLPLAKALGAPTLLYLGDPPVTIWSIGLPIVMVIMLAGSIIGFTWIALGKVGRISAIEALRSGTSGSLGKRRLRWNLTSVRRLPVQQWLGVREALRPSNALLLGVLALCTLTMALPINVATTLENPRIATYLGSGQADLRIDVRAGTQDLKAVEDYISADERISKFTSIVRREHKMETASGEWESVLIDIGNHEAFPMNYIAGNAPKSANEISLSYNQAEATQAQVGSKVSVRTTEGDKEFTVTGVYQDITNNGLTAKAMFDDAAPALWQLVYADAANKDQEQVIAEDLRQKFPGVQVTGVSEYASQFFGATSSQIRIIAALACAIALGLAFLITVLFTVLVLSRERLHIGILKALGCTNKAVSGQYLTRFGLLTFIGILLGLALTFTLGESSLGLVLGSRGAPNVELLPDPLLTGVGVPAALFITVISAVAIALRRIRAFGITTL